MRKHTDINLWASHAHPTHHWREIYKLQVPLPTQKLKTKCSDSYVAEIKTGRLGSISSTFPQ